MARVLAYLTTSAALSESTRARQPDRRSSRSPFIAPERGSPASSITVNPASNVSSPVLQHQGSYSHFQLDPGRADGGNGQHYSPPEYKRQGTFGFEHSQSFSNLSSFSEKSILSLEEGGPCAMWWTEIVWLCTSVILVVIIVVLLRYFDGQSLPEWPQGVSVNTLLAFLVALCRALSAWPVVEGISQLKWNWFAMKKRRLADFEAFDQASRGPYGSLTLLRITKGRLLGGIAAIIMVTGLITAPITQASITYPSRIVESNNGTAIVMSIQLYSFFFDQMVTSSVDLDTRMKQAIQQGIYNPVNEVYRPLAPICSSAECKWPRFSSLGVCSSVKDVTEFLSVANVSNTSTTHGHLNQMTPETRLQNASLPNGVFLVGGVANYSLNITTPVVELGQRPTNHTLSFLNNKNLLESAISNFFVIYANQTERLAVDPVTFRAAEVLLHFCVSSYDVEVVDGIDSTNQSSPTVDIISTDGVGTRSGKPIDGLLVLGSEESPDEEFTINPVFVEPLTQYLGSTFRGAYSNAIGITAQGTTATSDAIGSAMFRGLYEEGAGINRLGSQGLQEIILNTTENVAASLTNALRSMGSSEIGTAYVSETYIAVNWVWLTFLIAQVTLSIIFVAIVVVHTSRLKIPVIKSSAVASLFALNTCDKAELERSVTHSAPRSAVTKRRHRDMEVEFNYGSMGWSLSFTGRKGSHRSFFTESPV